MLVGILGHSLVGPKALAQGQGFDVGRYLRSHIVYLAPKTWLKARVLVLVGNLVHV